MKSFNKMGVWQGVIVSTIGGLLVGCGGDGSGSSVSSAEVDTSQVVANMRVEASSDTSAAVTVGLTLNDERSQPIALNNNDQIAVTAAGGVQVLAPAVSGRVGRYETSTAAGAAGTTYGIAITRTGTPDDSGTWFPSELVASPDFADNFVDAQNSTVILPASFSLDTPVANATVSRDDTVTVSWTPSGTEHEVRFTYQSDCPEPPSAGVQRTGEIAVSGDPGSVDVSVADLVSNLSETCRIILTIFKETSGTTDPLLATGSTLIAVQTRSVTIRYVPN